MERFARWVLGYHGCTAELANELIGGARPVTSWPLSTNRYDWLGTGIYFWEHGPERAMHWAREKYGDDAAVVGAIIQLGRSFDLLDVEFTSLLLPAYQREQEDAHAAGQDLPTNRGPDDDLGGRYLDCRVINACLQALPEFQTVRCAFWEGARAPSREL